MMMYSGSRVGIFSVAECFGRSGKLPVVPTGLFISQISTQDWRPGLSSAVPSGLILQSIGSHAHLNALEANVKQCTSQGLSTVAVKITSIRLDALLADEAARILGAKSRTEAVHIALREIVALKRFKNLMKKNAGKLSFDGYVE
jgi:Arc/MetJ family transcription regulator